MKINTMENVLFFSGLPMVANTILYAIIMILCNISMICIDIGLIRTNISRRKEIMKMPTDSEEFKNAIFINEIYYNSHLKEIGECIAGVLIRGLLIWMCIPYMKTLMGYMIYRTLVFGPYNFIIIMIESSWLVRHLAQVARGKIRDDHNEITHIILGFYAVYMFLMIFSYLLLLNT